MSRIETQASIEAWRRATFGGGGTLLRMAVRAHQEMSELLVKAATTYADADAVTLTQGQRTAILRELADVAIVLYGVAELGGFDLRADAHAMSAAADGGFHAIPWEFGIPRCCTNANAALAEVIGDCLYGKIGPVHTRLAFRWLERAVALLDPDSTIDAEVDAKMAINRARKWAATDPGPADEGPHSRTGHHVEAADQVAP